MKTITLTEKQIWFIKCAIDSKNSVLPLSEESLSARKFKEDYGISKREAKREIEELRQKLK